MTITAGGSPITDWSVDVTTAAPQKVLSVRNGSPAWEGSGTVMTVRSNRNGALAAGASTGFGFTVNGGTAPPPQVGACTAS